MSVSTIPQFHAAMSQKFDGFDPLLSEWDDVELSQLRDAHNFLIEERVNFQEMILEDKKAGYPASSYVCSIFEMFEYFLFWTEVLPGEYLNPSSTGEEKHHALRNLCMDMSFLWMSWLETEYEPLAVKAQSIPQVAPIDKVELAKMKNEKTDDDKMRDVLFNSIVGTNAVEKERVFDVMKALCKG